MISDFDSFGANFLRQNYAFSPICQEAVKFLDRPMIVNIEIVNIFR